MPAAEIERAIAFQDLWGGIALPPAPAYEGGPRVLEADLPEGPTEDGWRFPAGNCRVSMAHGFMIGPGGEFGILLSAPVGRTGQLKCSFTGSRIRGRAAGAGADRIRQRRSSRGQRRVATSSGAGAARRAGLSCGVRPRFTSVRFTPVRSRLTPGPDPAPSDPPPSPPDQAASADLDGPAGQGLPVGPSPRAAPCRSLRPGTASEPHENRPLHDHAR